MKNFEPVILGIERRCFKEELYVEQKMVRTAGLVPARACDREIFLPTTVFTADATAPFVAWTIPSALPRDPVLGAARLVSIPSA